MARGVPVLFGVVEMALNNRKIAGIPVMPLPAMTGSYAPASFIPARNSG
jgi:hypothetical protein